MREKVILGMSGGVDSCAAAIILKRQGYQVIGLWLDLFEEGEYKSFKKVKEIADYLDIPLYKMNVRDQFEDEVIRPFVSDYINGITSVPCIHCNASFKWKMLLKASDQYDANWIATGHYVIIDTINGKLVLKKAKDRKKDQSYFLWNLPQKILTKSLTPIGNLTKSEVRELVKIEGLAEFASKKESMGICFLSGQTIDEYILHKSNHDQKKKIKPGKILDVKGKHIGNHKGIPFYTVGQKRNLQLFSHSDLYVKSLDPLNNIIVADRKENLNDRTFMIKDFQFFNLDDILSGEQKIYVRIRGIGLNPEESCTIDRKGKKLKIDLQDDAWAICSGQSAVFYQNDFLIGGGIIV